jgi:hypothetical protein
MFKRWLFGCKLCITNFDGRKFLDQVDDYKHPKNGSARRRIYFFRYNH